MKVMVGMSGGVDSSVSALLLKQQGYEVEALFMKNWDEAEPGGPCSWEADVEDALRVCEKLDIRLNTIDMSAQYWEAVFNSFLEDYRKGLTPNPDVLCNQEIKFRSFMDYALELGGGRIATGHYARISGGPDVYQLRKGRDRNKDQSYFLCRLTGRQLSRSLFPVGDLEKSAVRRMAAAAGLPVHDKKDSTGICFIGERPFREFLARFIPRRLGLIRTRDGKVLGEHEGVHFYTLGQRRGLGIGGVRETRDAPWYVVEKDMDNNILYVAQGQDNPLLYSSGLTAARVHWIGEPPDRYPYSCRAKTRYRQPDQACTVEPSGEDSVSVAFNMPQKAVTPGQYVVFYQDDVCLGSGIIKSRW
jgi:tRNA-specific 2-thiouridylase